MWLPIQDFPIYEISNEGVVANIDTGRRLTPTYNQKGLLMVGLMRGGVQYKRQLDLLVARTFLAPHENENFTSLIHLDGDQGNVAEDNLMWRPRWFRIAFHDELRSPDFHQWTAPFYVEQTGEVFNNPYEAASTLGVLPHSVYKSLINQVPVWPDYYRFAFVD
jgi:NUMOD4 motif.